MGRDQRYHITLEGDSEADKLGLMLEESPVIRYDKRLINPYAAKAGTGDTQYSDLTEWSVLAQRDWRDGRGHDEYDSPTGYYDSNNLETRIEGQITLGPLPQNPSGTLPNHEPGDVSWYQCEWPGAEMNTTGESATFYIYTSRTWGQMFHVQSVGDFHALSVDVKIAKTASTAASIKLSIYDNDGGEPGTELVSKTLAAGSVSTSLDWVTFTFTTPYELTGSWYWIVLSSSASGASTAYSWECSGFNPYWFGMCYASKKIGSGDWTKYANGDFLFKVHWASVAHSQSFTTPAAGVTCTSVQLFMSTANNIGALNVRLCENDGGKPGTVLQTKSISPTWTYGWYEVTWDSGEALSGSTLYHITVAQAAEGTEPPNNTSYFIWGGNSAGGYDDGVSCKKIGSGAWTTKTEDLYFRVNVNELDGAPVAFARYNDKLYCAAGDTVYEWAEASSSWTSSDAIASKSLTDLETWGGYLWAARGGDNILRRYDASSWADVSATYATLLKAGGGYLHRTGHGSNTHSIYYTTDGSSWSSAMDCGAGDYDINAMEWYRDMLVAATDVRLWGISAETAYPLVSWDSQEDTDNGTGMLAWSRTACLYIPLRFGLYRWNGDTITAVGPEQGTGLPYNRAGKIKSIVGTCNWMFVAVDAGSSGYSSVLAYNGMGGWHELFRAEKTNQRILTTGFETISSPNRLWIGLENGTRYLQLPDYTDNPWQWSGYEFNATGELKTSWFGGELLEVVKDLHEVVIRGDGFATGQYIEVFYEIDRSDAWTYLGKVDSGTREALVFPPSYFSTKTIGSSSTTTTIELASGHTTEDMIIGEWVRINDEIRQIASVTDSNTLVLETTLTDAPSSGDCAYASRPAGREFRLRLVLSTTAKASTPKITACFLRYQNNVLDRFVHSIMVRVEDDMKDLAGNPYPHTAAALRVKLDTWAMRATQFSLWDLDGVERTVKVTGTGEGGFQAEQGALPARYTSTVSMNFVEVA